MKKRRLFRISVFAILLLPVPFIPWGYYAISGLLRGEHFYHGLPTSYWSREIREWTEFWYPRTPPRRWSLFLKRLSFGRSPTRPTVLSGDPSSVWVCMDLLQDDQVRYQALRALGLIGPPARPAVPAIVDAVKRDAATSRSVLDVESEALVGIGSSAVPFLAQALADEHDEVRQWAAATLHRMGPKAEEAVPALIAALEDVNPAVSVPAAQTLEEIGPKARAAVPALIALWKRNYREFDPLELDPNRRLDWWRVITRYGPRPEQAAAQALAVIDGEAAKRAGVTWKP